MERSKSVLGPFRATRLWNEIVSDFRSGIPTKRHRWKMRFYDDCFMSNEAVDWLHNYLQRNENYGPWVTREQAIQLMDKFVQSKVIESVRPFKGGPKESFEDNGSLYKLVHLSPIKKLRSALHGNRNLRSLTPSPKQSRSRGAMRPLSLNTKLMNEVVEQEWNIKSKLLPSDDKKEEKVIGPSQRRRQSKPGLLKRSRSLGEMDKQTSSSSSLRSMEEQGQVGLTSDKTEAVWKHAALTRLRRLLGLFTLDGVVNVDTIQGKGIVHNSTQLSRSGVVVLSDKSDDLPHWVLSAMKCIANWPQKQDSDLPDYDGFEKDVFHTISNYFQSLEEPLTTFNLYSLITQAYVLGKRRDEAQIKLVKQSTVKESLPPRPVRYIQNGSSKGVDRRNLQRGIKASGFFGSQERIFCITKSRSVDHLNVNTAKDEELLHPVRSVGGVHRPYLKGSAANVCRVQSLRVQSQQETCQRSSTDDALFLTNGRPKSFAGCSPQNEYENIAKYVDKPTSLSKVDSGSSGPTPSLDSNKYIRLEGKRRYSVSRKSLRLSKKFGSASDLFHKLIGRKVSSSHIELGGSVPDLVASTIQPNTQTRSKSLSPQGQYPTISTQTSSTSLTMMNSPSDGFSPSQPIPDDGSKRVSPPYPLPIRATLSVSEIVKSNPNSTNSSPIFLQDSQSSFSGEPFLRGKSVSSVELRASTPISVDRETSTGGDPPSLQLEANKSYCEEAMRLALLLLPPPNRRKLHLLFKMMSKVERNEELQLYPQESKRDLLLHAFTRCILRTESEVDFDEAYALRIVAYLMDNFNTILAPSSALQVDVSRRLDSDPSGEYNARAGSSVAYCRQITKEEYRDNIQTNSLKAMEDLLETIINDKNMDVKEKKKRLKTFQKAYPKIYKKRLPTASSEAELFPSKPKIKQPMLKRSLTKFKPIR